MLPAAIKLRNYRAFAGEHRLELRPLTMLYGDNNAGKSALLRLLPLIADSVAEDATGALRLESEATYGSTLSDLQWKGEIDEDQDPDLGVGFEWSDECEVQEVEYTLIRKRRRVLINRCVLRARDQEVELDWVPLREEEDATALSYDYRRDGGAPARAPIDFRGLVPEDPPQALESVLGPLRRQLASLRKNVQWLQAKRQAPGRRMPVPSGLLKRMQTDGRDAAQVLYANPEVRRQVSRWYERAIGRFLDAVDSPPDEFRLALSNARHAQAFEVDLIDSGQGVLQVLPVLVALALSRSGSGPRVLAIEEPESHLQPSLQLGLCEEICRTVAREGRVVVETHSQQMLLGVQLALLRGELQPEDVVIYWVRQDDQGRSFADPVTLDEDAYLQGPWPDPFASTREAARRVIMARREKSTP